MQTRPDRPQAAARDTRCGSRTAQVCHRCLHGCIDLTI